MIFETERLLVRPWTVDDVEGAFQMFGDPEVMRYLGRYGAADTVPSLEAMRERLGKMVERLATMPELQGWFSAAVVEKASGGVVGGSILKPLPDGNDVYTPDIEVGWHFARAHWGKGYATESGAGAIRYGFEVKGLDVIHSLVYSDNLASRRVMEKLGLAHEGVTDRYYGVELEHYTLWRG